MSPWARAFDLILARWLEGRNEAAERMNVAWDTPDEGKAIEEMHKWQKPIDQMQWLLLLREAAIEDWIRCAFCGVPCVERCYDHPQAAIIGSCCSCGAIQLSDECCTRKDPRRG